MESGVDDHRAARARTARDTAVAVRDEVLGPSELVRELDHRTTDRIDVWLLWCERDGRVFVAVADEKTGDRFSIEVRDHDRPLDVFWHPYAYAAWRGIDPRSGTAG